MENTDIEFIINSLKAISTKDHFEKLKRFGINQDFALGVKIPDVRNLAKVIGKNSSLAKLLLDTNIHEAKILASFIEDPSQLNETTIFKYIDGFNSWDICDQTCYMIGKTKYCEKLIYSFCSDNQEYRKRTAFVLMCNNAVHNKKAPDEQFIEYLSLIEKEAWDERNFVRKAVNWALRQIGKRNLFLHQKAIECAERISIQNTKTAKWIAADALRELNNDKIIARLITKENRK